jgi:hypothetical protein
MRRIFRSSPATPGRTSLTASHVAVAPLRCRDCGQPARSGLNVLYTCSDGAGSWRTLCGLDARPRHGFAPPHSGQHRSGFGADECGGRRSRARAVGARRGADTGPLLRTLLRLRHDLVMIGRATISPLPESRSRIETPLARVGVASPITCAQVGRRCKPVGGRRHSSTWNRLLIPMQRKLPRSVARV